MDKKELNYKKILWIVAISLFIIVLIWGMIRAAAS